MAVTFSCFNLYFMLYFHHKKIDLSLSEPGVAEKEK